jgi:hypothetical protein
MLSTPVGRFQALRVYVREAGHNLNQIIQSSSPKQQIDLQLKATIAPSGCSTKEFNKQMVGLIDCYSAKDQVQLDMKNLCGTW